MDKPLKLILDTIKSTESESILIECAKLSEKSINSLLSSSLNPIEKTDQIFDTLSTLLLVCIPKASIKNRRQITRCFGRIAAIRTGASSYDADLCQRINDLLYSTFINDARTLSNFDYDNNSIPISDSDFDFITRLDLILEPPETCLLFQSVEHFLPLFASISRVLVRFSESLQTRDTSSGGSSSMSDQCTRAVIVLRIFNSYLVRIISQSSSIIRSIILGTFSFDTNEYKLLLTQRDIEAIQKLPEALALAGVANGASRDVVTQSGFAIVMLLRICEEPLHSQNAVVHAVDNAIQFVIKNLLKKQTTEAMVFDSHSDDINIECEHLHKKELDKLISKVFNHILHSSAASSSSTHICLVLALLRGILILSKPVSNDSVNETVDFSNSCILSKTFKIELFSSMLIFISSCADNPSVTHYSLQSLHVLLTRCAASKEGLGASSADIVKCMTLLVELHDSQDKLIVSAANEALVTLGAAIPTTENKQCFSACCNIFFVKRKNTSRKALCDLLTILSGRFGSATLQSEIPDVIDFCLESLSCLGTSSVASNLLQSLLKGSSSASNRLIAYSLSCSPSVLQQLLPTLNKSVGDALALLLNHIKLQDVEGSRSGRLSSDFRMTGALAVLLTNARQNGRAEWRCRGSGDNNIDDWCLEVLSEAKISNNRRRQLDRKQRQETANGGDSVDMTICSYPEVESLILRVPFQVFKLAICHPDAGIATHSLTCAVTCQQSGTLPCKPECELMLSALVTSPRVPSSEWRNILISCLKRFASRVREGAREIVLSHDLSVVEEGISRPEFADAFALIRDLYKESVARLNPGCPPDHAALALDVVTCLLDHFGPRAEGTSPTDGSPLQGSLVGDLLGFFDAFAKRIFRLNLVSSWEAARAASLRALTLSRCSLMDGSGAEVEWLSNLQEGVNRMLGTKTVECAAGQSCLMLAFDSLLSTASTRHAVVRKSDARTCNDVRPPVSLILKNLMQWLHVDEDMLLASEGVDADQLKLVLNNERDELAHIIFLYIIASACKFRSQIIAANPFAVLDRSGSLHGLMGCLSSCLFLLQKSHLKSSTNHRVESKSCNISFDQSPHVDRFLEWLPSVIFSLMKASLGLIAESSTSVLVNPFEIAMKNDEGDSLPGQPSALLKTVAASSKGLTGRVDCRGHPIPSNAQEDFTGLAVVAWMAIRSAGEVLEVVASLMQLSGADNGNVRVQAFGDMLLRYLLATRHPGAIEKIRAAFAMLCKRLVLLADEPKLCALPSRWVRSLVTLLSGEIISNNSDDDDDDDDDNSDANLMLPPAVRRSQAVSLAFIALASADPPRMTPLLLNSIFSFLMSPCEVVPIHDEDSEKVVHCLNILRTLAKDSSLAANTLIFIPELASQAMRQLASPLWPVRNSANLLLSACMRRLFPSDRENKLSKAKGYSFASGADARTGMRASNVPLESLSNRCPRLPLILFELLHAEGGVDSEGRRVSALLFMNRSRPSNFSDVTWWSVDANEASLEERRLELANLCMSAEGATSPAVSAALMHGVRTCLSHPCFFVRDFAARLIALTLLDRSGCQRGISAAIVPSSLIHSDDESVSAVLHYISKCIMKNYVQLSDTTHGYLLLAQELLVNVSLPHAYLFTHHDQDNNNTSSVTKLLVACTHLIGRSYHSLPLIVSTASQVCESILKGYLLARAAKLVTEGNHSAVRSMICLRKIVIALSDISTAIVKSVCDRREARNTVGEFDIAVTNMTISMARLRLVCAQHILLVQADNGINETSDVIKVSEFKWAQADQESVRVGRKIIMQFSSSHMSFEKCCNLIGVKEFITSFSRLVITSYLSDKFDDASPAFQWQLSKSLSSLLSLALGVECPFAALVRELLVCMDTSIFDKIMLSAVSHLNARSHNKWSRLELKSTEIFMKSALMSSAVSNETMNECISRLITLAEPYQEAITRLEVSELMPLLVNTLVASSKLSIASRFCALKTDDACTEWMVGVIEILVLGLTDERSEVQVEAQNGLLSVVPMPSLDAANSHVWIASNLDVFFAGNKRSVLELCVRMIERSLKCHVQETNAVGSFIFSKSNQLEKVDASNIENKLNSRTEMFEKEADNINSDPLINLKIWTTCFLAKLQDETHPTDQVFLESLRQRLKFCFTLATEKGLPGVSEIFVAYTKERLRQYLD